MRQVKAGRVYWHDTETEESYGEDELAPKLSWALKESFKLEARQPPPRNGRPSGGDPPSERALAISAVIRMQAIFRGKMQRRDDQAMVRACCLIQALHRGRRARRVELPGLGGATVLSRLSKVKAAQAKLKRTHFTRTATTTALKPGSLPPTRYFRCCDVHCILGGPCSQEFCLRGTSSAQ